MEVRHFTEDEAPAIIAYCKENGIKYRVKKLKKPIHGERVNVSIWAYIDWRDYETCIKYNMFVNLVRWNEARRI